MEISKINYLLDNFDKIDWTKETLDDFVANLKSLNLETVDFDSKKKITEFLEKIEVQESSENIQKDNKQELNKTEEPKDKIVMPKKINKLLILIIVSLVLIGSGVVIYKLLSDGANKKSDNIESKIVLNGDAVVTLEVNSQYEELGAKVENSDDKKINNKIIINGKVDISKLGTYEMSYSVIDSNTNTILKAKRTVKVIDSTSPVIKLNGSDLITMEASSTYNELSAIVTDNYDKDIQNKLAISGNVDTTKIGEYTITYSATDSSNNKATEIKRIIKIIDTKKPTLTVEPKTVTINYGDSYDLKNGIRAIDNADGDITSKIVISGTVNSFKLGSNTVVYSITDMSLNKAEITRTINVIYTDQLLEAEMTNLVSQYYNQIIKGRVTGISYYKITISDLSSSEFNISKLINPVTGEQCTSSSYSMITVLDSKDYNSNITIENHLDCGSYQSPL